MGEAFLVSGDPTLIIQKLIQAQKPYESSWVDSMDENKNTEGYKYFSLPDSRKPVKVTFYFNETPYALYSYSGSKWNSTDPVSGSTKIVTPGGSFSIQQTRCTWRMGVSSDGRPYSYTSSGVGGSDCYWNVLLTLEY